MQGSRVLGSGSPAGPLIWGLRRARPLNKRRVVVSHIADRLAPCDGPPSARTGRAEQRLPLVADMTRVVRTRAASVAESLTSDSIEVEGELYQTDHDGPHSESQANPEDDDPSVGYRLWDIVDNRLMEK